MDMEFWEVNFDMTDIEQSLEMSTEICRLGAALSKSPERLLRSGDPWVASWQIGKLANWQFTG